MMIQLIYFKDRRFLYIYKHLRMKVKVYLCVYTRIGVDQTYSHDSNSSDLPPFFIIVIHTQPTDTVREIDGLATVFDSASTYFSTNAGMILGDLNADCSYLSNIRNTELLLFTNPTFTWWINKDADTTSGASDCAYDR